MTEKSIEARREARKQERLQGMKEDAALDLPVLEKMAETVSGISKQANDFLPTANDLMVTTTPDGAVLGIHMNNLVAVCNNISTILSVLQKNAEAVLKE